MASETGPDYVFVSYASADAPAVERWAELLRRGGVDVWRDQDSITPGAEWQPSIARAIAGAKVILFFVSAASAASRHTKSEVQLAYTKGRPVLPIYLENTELPDDFLLGLGLAQAIDISKLGRRGAHEALRRALAYRDVIWRPPDDEMVPLPSKSKSPFKAGEESAPTPKSPSTSSGKAKQRRPGVVMFSLAGAFLIIVGAGTVMLRPERPSVQPLPVPVRRAIIEPAPRGVPVDESPETQTRQASSLIQRFIGNTIRRAGLTTQQIDMLVNDCAEPATFFGRTYHRNELRDHLTEVSAELPFWDETIIAAVPNRVSAGQVEIDVRSTVNKSSFANDPLAAPELYRSTYVVIFDERNEPRLQSVREADRP